MQYIKHSTTIMITKGYLKPGISIDLIGKKNFWLGVILGIAYSLVLSYFFNYCRESLRFITFFGDPYILSPKDFKKYDLFFASFSASFGFGIVIVSWFFGYNNRIGKRYLKRFAITNALFVSIVALSVVSRFGSILPIILYGRNGYDNQFNILEDFRLLLILTPLFVFFSNWNGVRAFLRTRYWILISFVLYCLFSLFIFKTTSLNKDVLNAHYYNQNKERFDFIDQELRKAIRMGITFPEDIKTTLQKRYALRTQALVLELKVAFNSGRVLPLDTLILEKIIIHNLNRQEHFYTRFDKEINLNWSYALPEKVYAQIQMHEVGSPEMLLLFEILREQINIFNAEDNWKYFDSFSLYERELALTKFNMVRHTNTIFSRLVQVVDRLKSDKQYQQYHCVLPDVEYIDQRGRQLYYELDL